MKFNWVLLLATAMLAYSYSSKISMAQGDRLQTPDSVAARLLLDGGVPGGVGMSIPCEGIQKIQYKSSGGTVEDELKQLQKAVPALSWLKEGEGYTILIGNDGATSLLNVQLPPLVLNFTDIREASDQLLDRPEVEAQQLNIHLKLFEPSIGYSSVHQGGTLKPKTLQLPAGTLANDLNQVSRAVGHKVWAFSASNCSGQSYGRFIWIQ